MLPAAKFASSGNRLNGAMRPTKKIGSSASQACWSGLLPTCGTRSATRAITIAAIATQNHARLWRKPFIGEGSIQESSQFLVRSSESFRSSGREIICKSAELFESLAVQRNPLVRRGLMADKNDAALR